MIFLLPERATKPSTRGHRSPFEFQVTHVRYWERVLSRHTRRRTDTQTKRFRVTSSRALQVLIRVKQPTKDSIVDHGDIPCAVPRYRTDEEICRL